MEQKQWVSQGVEAGGHRAIFLTSDLTSQLGTLALVPQVVDAVKVPVIAAGGIADGRGYRGGARVGRLRRANRDSVPALPRGDNFATSSCSHQVRERQAPSAITNVLTGRPARALVNRIVREVGPLATGVPSSSLGFIALEPLRKKAEAQGSSDFSGLSAGEAAALCRELPAGELTFDAGRRDTSEARRAGRAG